MTGARLTDEQRIDWLRLIRSENVGPRTFRALVNQFGGASAALEALPDLARKGGRLILKVTTRAEAEREMEAATRLGARFVALGEPEYEAERLAVSPGVGVARGVKGTARGGLDAHETAPVWHIPQSLTTGCRRLL